MRIAVHSLRICFVSYKQYTYHEVIDYIWHSLKALMIGRTPVVWAV
jgi:hypothetical protein